YSATDGDGTYSFYTGATDKAGNVETVPSGDADSTLLDTAKPGSSASSPLYSTDDTFYVSYVADDAGSSASGLDTVGLYVDTPAAGGYTLAHTVDPASGSDSFSSRP